MAQKRMFSKDVIRTDEFLDMSLSAQALYFHLCLDADVRGFVSPRLIMRMVNAPADDLKVLVTKGFVIPFESGVIVITHWNVHNNVRETHEASTQFPKESKSLTLSQQGLYQLQENYSSTTVELPQSIDKVSIDKVSIGERDTPTLKYNSFNKLDDTLIERVSQDYGVPVAFVLDVKESMGLWLAQTGKKYKDYDSALRNWVKRDRAKFLLEAKKLNNRRGGVVDARTV